MDSTSPKGMVADVAKETASKVAEKMEKSVVSCVTSSLLGSSSKCNKDKESSKTCQEQKKRESNSQQQKQEQNNFQVKEQQKNTSSDVKKSSNNAKKLYSSQSTATTTIADTNAKKATSTFSAASTQISSLDSRSSGILAPALLSAAPALVAPMGPSNGGAPMLVSAIVPISGTGGVPALVLPMPPYPSAKGK
ncbi:hypothetical protein AQUCO_00200762v1 [Aquilegia coerulea]|uniref:Uncharacterized protein n=1 Tax=Aquilegia coerulea TaxID=218851 RepID=A0A2G5F4R5_AQUCA|nr:hypothetical protein AQUCO_00200762v1 [Aquilegia coerulea]